MITCTHICIYIYTCIYIMHISSFQGRKSSTFAFHQGRPFPPKVTPSTRSGSCAPCGGAAVEPCWRRSCVAAVWHLWTGGLDLGEIEVTLPKFSSLLLKSDQMILTSYKHPINYCSWIIKVIFPSVFLLFNLFQPLTLGSRRFAEVSSGRLRVCLYQGPVGIYLEDHAS